MKSVLKALTFCLVTFSFLSIGVASPVTSTQGLPISKQIQSVDKEKEKTIDSTNALMMHLSLAALAIDLGLAKEAAANLTQAQKICSSLEASSPEVISMFDFQIGKATYLVEGVERDYYLPVSDNISLEGQLAEKNSWRKNPKIKVKNISLVRSSLALNLKAVDSAVKAAEADVQKGSFHEARVALQGVYNDALQSRTVVTDPVWTVWSNVVLARDFVTSEQYDNARYALKTAKSEIKKLEKDKTLSKSASEAMALRYEIDVIEKNLNKKDPTLLKRAEAKLSSWSHKVKEWF
ncbi:MAG: YfdX family protein [Bdellovibrionales bacterium]|nr:YfdX family protein [Bdellovibrionales bacterium]